MYSALSSRELLRSVFEFAAVPRVPFIPWVFSHAAKLEQISVRRMYSDPSLYVKCLQNAQQLYGYDAIISGFDSTLEAELCGCPVSWRNDNECTVLSNIPASAINQIADIRQEAFEESARFHTVIESFRRVKLVYGSKVAMVVTVTGPLTVTTSVTGKNILSAFEENPDEAKSNVEIATGFLLNELQVYCQLEPDIIAIADNLINQIPSEYLPWLNSILAPALNTIRFYNAFSVLLPGDSINPATGIELGFDGIVFSGVDRDSWMKIADGRNCVLGQAIPSAILDGDKKGLQDYLESNLPEAAHSGVFLTTGWELPADTPPDNMLLVMEMLSKGKQ